MSAVEGIVHLTNSLHPLMSQNSKDGGLLTTERCNEIFETYRAKHFRRLTRICAVSGQAVRFESQRTWISRIMARYVLPWCSDLGRLLVFSSILRGAPSFNHLPKDMTKPINH